MAALISIGASSESSQQCRSRIRYLGAQYGIIGVAGLLGLLAVGLPRVILAVGLVAACSAQTLIGRALLVPKLVSRKELYPLPIPAQALDSTPDPTEVF